MQHYNVLIATPGRDVVMPYLRSLMDTVEILNKENITFKFINRHSPQVNQAREGTMMNDDFMDITNNKPLHGNATYDVMFWIDSDMSWTPEDFLKLYRSEKEIVSGIYASDRKVLMYQPHNMQDLLKTEPFEVTHIAGGFFAVKQGVFEQLERPWWQTVYMKKVIEGQEYMIPMGGDWSLSERLRQKGYKLYIDPTVVLGHHKTVEVRPQSPFSQETLS